MALSDVYASPHHASIHQEHHVAHYDGSSLEAVKVHLVCDYSNLFATFAATATDDAPPRVISPIRERYTLRTTEPLTEFTYNASPSRAPPLA